LPEGLPAIRLQPAPSDREVQVNAHWLPQHYFEAVAAIHAAAARCFEVSQPMGRVLVGNLADCLVLKVSLSGQLRP
jgi:imidazolonepropionase-like amidohydrolase